MLRRRRTSSAPAARPRRLALLQRSIVFPSGPLRPPGRRRGGVPLSMPSFCFFPSLPRLPLPPLASRACGLLVLGAHAGQQRLSTPPPAAQRGPNPDPPGPPRGERCRPLVWKCRCRFCIPGMVCWIRRWLPLARCGRGRAQGTPSMDWWPPESMGQLLQGSIPRSSKRISLLDELDGGD